MTEDIRNNKLSNPFRCAIYMRSTTDIQGSCSLTEQELQCRKAADEHGLVVQKAHVEIYVHNE